MASFSLCAASVPAPVSIPIRNVSLQNSGISRGLAISIGSPPQDLSFAPFLRSNNTYFYNQTAACSSFTTAQCIQERGGGFNQALSTTWSRLSTYISPESVINTVPDIYSSDVLTISGGPQNLTNYPIGEIGTGETLYDPFDNSLGLGSNSTFLTALSNLGLIASRSFSIFFGLAGTDQQMDGSLVIGGFDSAKVSGANQTNPIQAQTTAPVSEFTAQCGTGLFVTVEDISLNLPDGSNSSILGGNFTSGLSMCIDPAYPGITLPPNTGDVLRGVIGSPFTMSGIDGAGAGNVPFYSSWIYPTSDVYQGDLTFHFGNGLDIAVTNDQLVVPAWSTNANGIAVQKNETLRKMLINVLGWPVLNVQPTLGQPFLTAAHLMVNYDSNEFTISNVNLTNSTIIVAISPTATCIPQAPVSTLLNAANSTISSTPAPVVTSSDSLSVGANAGIAVGCVACVALLAAALLIFIRRRKVRRRTAYSSQDRYGMPTSRNTFQAGELPAKEKIGELPDHQPLPPELLYLQEHQLAQELPS